MTKNESVTEIVIPFGVLIIGIFLLFILYSWFTTEAMAHQYSFTDGNQTVTCKGYTTFCGYHFKNCDNSQIYDCYGPKNLRRLDG